MKGHVCNVYCCRDIWANSTLEKSAIVDIFEWHWAILAMVIAGQPQNCDNVALVLPGFNICFKLLLHCALWTNLHTQNWLVDLCCSSDLQNTDLTTGCWIPVDLILKGTRIIFFLFLLTDSKGRLDDLFSWKISSSRYIIWDESYFWCFECKNNKVKIGP